MNEDQKKHNNFDQNIISSNLLGATTYNELMEAERDILDIKIAALKLSDVTGDFDYAHLKSIHRFLFEDIYSWAGKDRNEMGLDSVFRKGTCIFTHASRIPETAKELFGALKAENFFRDQDIDTAPHSLAVFLNGLNRLHPFREGNGRTQRLFVEQLAINVGYDLDISTVSRSVMNQASILGCKGITVGFEKIIKSNISIIQ